MQSPFDFHAFCDRVERAANLLIFTSGITGLVAALWLPPPVWLFLTVPWVIGAVFCLVVYFEVTRTNGDNTSLSNELGSYGALLVWNAYRWPYLLARDLIKKAMERE